MIWSLNEEQEKKMGKEILTSQDIEVSLRNQLPKTEFVH